jgi:hypothetical protein
MAATKMSRALWEVAFMANSVHAVLIRQCAIRAWFVRKKTRILANGNHPQLSDRELDENPPHGL